MNYHEECIKLNGEDLNYFTQLKFNEVLSVLKGVKGKLVSHQIEAEDFKAV